MDSGTVKTFTDAAALLLPALVQYASIEPTTTARRKTRR